MKLKRRFDGFLSEEHILQQLLALIVVLVASFFIFWGISALFYGSIFRWQDIIALYLDPGVFGGAGEHDAFRLIITFVGIFVFTALLITVFTNVFSNISEAYKKGERRYKGLRGHTVILGANRMLIGMLSRLRTDGSNNPILIMTSTPIEPLRDKVEAYFGDKHFMDRLYFYFDARDNENNLKDACVLDAKEIFIIGEEGEVDHDSVSISCCEKLEKICAGSGPAIKCFLILDSQSSADVYHYYSRKFSNNTRLKVDVIDIKEYIAEQTLLGLNGKEQLPIDGKGIGKESDNYLNFIVYGFTPMAKAVARTAAHLCHFPNFDEKTNARRTVITIIDSDIKSKMNRFISEYSNLFELSHYKYISFEDNGGINVRHSEPLKEYGDFLDIEWVFVDTDTSSPECKNYVESIVNDESQTLAVAICQESQDNNISNALHLPERIYDKARNIPIYVHLWERGDVINKAYETGQFGNIYCFGTGTIADRDPLFRDRLERGQRVNSVYAKLYSGPEWYDLIEAHKFSSIYCANSIPVKERSFGENLLEQKYDVCATEHRRWVIGELLLGFKAYTEKERTEYKRKINSEILKCGKKSESETWKWLKSQRKKTYKHIDIDAFDSLVDEDEKQKDMAIVANIPYILSETEEIFNPESQK